MSIVAAYEVIIMFPVNPGSERSLSLPYRVLLAGYRSTADATPVEGVSSSDCTIPVAGGGGDPVPIAGSLKPDLIILYDLIPECDGLKLMKRLKRNPDTEDIPVILIVPDGHAEYVIRGLDAGADDCLKKSADPRELLARIRVIMRKMDTVRALRSCREALFLQATMDPLTGLYNRHYLKPVIERNLASLKRYNRLCSLLMIEIDYLKTINTPSGRITGDEILKHLGSMVKSKLRAGDIAVRYGKNTLVVVLPETDAKGSLPVAERLRRLIEDHRFPGGTSLQITASIGITEFEMEDAGMDDIIGRCEEALVAAKGEGTNRIRRL